MYSPGLEYRVNMNSLILRFAMQQCYLAFHDVSMIVTDSTHFASASSTLLYVSVSHVIQPVASNIHKKTTRLQTDLY